ncbi:hypothetical protein E2C01_008620 [Portunus trituberculatus]|uniref:Uncharacterized protein n=1 Tax=Portunus trituberculatus TaxID=210409 RepID=A0A5B7D1A8_PORTR|nr:hypothetical protein [Portunus trituberculatus]
MKIATEDSKRYNILVVRKRLKTGSHRGVDKYSTFHPSHCLTLPCFVAANAWYSVGSDKFHSTQTTIEHSTMKIQVLPALSDNYMYLGRIQGGGWGAKGTEAPKIFVYNEQGCT